MGTSRLSVRIDEELKKQSQQDFDDLGLDLTSGITLYLKQVVREQGLPFTPKLEPFESRLARYEVE